MRARASFRGDAVEFECVGTVMDFGFFGFFFGFFGFFFGFCRQRVQASRTSDDNAWTVGGRQTTDGRGVGSLARTEEEEGRGG